MDDDLQQDIESQAASRTSTPLHVWIVGALALLWNGFGAYDYLMTRMRNTDYLASMMPSVDPQATLAWVDAFPVWAQFGWGLGVWGGLAGAGLLLLRSRWAPWAFGLSFVGAVLGLGYQIVAAPPLAGAQGPSFDLVPYAIILLAAALALYSRAMLRKGVLG